MVIALLVMLGLCSGSFSNAFVWRFYKKQSRMKGAASKTDAAYSILNGRSMCESCKHVLAPKDLVPLFSWLWLRGRCRYCNKPISKQNPLAEALLAGTFVGMYLWWPHDLSGSWSWLYFTLWLVVLVLFMVLSLYDFRWMLLPDKLLMPVLAAGVALLALRAFGLHEGAEVVKQAVLSIVVGGGLFWLLFQLSNGKWIGGGDVKLGFIIGLLLADWRLSVLMIFGSSLLGVVISFPALIAEKKGIKKLIPFGPFLMAATVLSLLFGMHILDWYMHTLGLR
jgi:prepilin signal peptidase PulO-like enzyme (type II secretory pathway)